MRDPHVQALHYRIASDESVSYDNPPKLEFSNEIGQFTAFDGKLSCYPLEHFPTEELAREGVEPFLRAWKMELDLTLQFGTIRFEFDASEIIDRNPPKPGEPVVLQVDSARMEMKGMPVNLHFTRKAYPEPPTNFITTPHVEMAYGRWLAYLEGNEPLLAVCYFIFTILVGIAGGTKEASKLFNTQLSLLKKYSELSSTRGNTATARKYSEDQEELSEREEMWLKDASRKLIYRLGEQASGAQLSRITTGDLPPL